MARSEKEKAKESKVALTFPKNYNYEWCYVMGKFRLYTYNDPRMLEIDATPYEIYSGAMSEHNDTLTNFCKKVLESNMDADIKAEVNRVGMRAEESFTKMYDPSPGKLFRITYGEPHYVRGKEPEEKK